MSTPHAPVVLTNAKKAEVIIYSKNALWCIKRDTPLRNAAIMIMVNPWFDRIVLVSGIPCRCTRPPNPFAGWGQRGRAFTCQH